MNPLKHFLQVRNSPTSFNMRDLIKYNTPPSPCEWLRYILQKNKMQPMPLGKATRVLIAFTLLSCSVFGQEKEVENLPKYDKAPIHFGFLLGLNYSNFRVQLVDDFRVRDTVYTATAE